MIPYFQYTTIHLGPIPIQVWGLWVALGFLVGACVARRRLRSLGMKESFVTELLGPMIFWSLVASRLVHVLVYEPGYYLIHPGEVLRIWEGGMSIYGGLIAAVLVAMVMMRRRHLNVWQYADATIFGLPIGIAIGRLGCFFIHDHPGTATDFFLGIKYPDGIVRHDLGLYESFSMLILFLLFLLLNNFTSPGDVKPPKYVAFFALWYSITRFFMDFLRTIDTRYFGLTPAQYLSILLFFFGLFLILRGIKTRARAGVHPARV